MSAIDILEIQKNYGCIPTSTSSSSGSSTASAGTTGSTAPTTIESATSTGQRQIISHFMTYLLFSYLVIYIH